MHEQLDATGSVVKKFHNIKPVFLYQLVFDNGQCVIPLAQMLTDAHDKPIFVPDFSISGKILTCQKKLLGRLTLFGAIVRAFTPFLSLSEYAAACYGEVIPKVYVRIDNAHVIHSFSSFLKPLIPIARIRRFYQCVLGLLIMATDKEDLKNILFAIFTIALSTTDENQPNKCRN